MKTLTFALLALAPLVVFGQEKSEKKTAEQVMQEVHDISEKYQMERLDLSVGYFKDSVSKFKAFADERAGAYKELNEALTDGDHILIEKASSNIYSNAYAIKLHAESQKRTGEELQSQLESAFSSDLITKARYLELRNMIRGGIAETGKELPAEYTKLIEKAKVIVPDYFAILERHAALR